MDRESELRRRLAAMAARQAERAASFERLRAVVAASDGGPAAPDAGAAPALPPVDDAPGERAPLVSIIVPVHNAPGDLERCLWALSRNTTYPAELLLIDDASTDPRVDPLLEWASGWGRARVLRNVQNLGFPGTVNRGLRACGGDVVLLNSDTEVGPRWLEQLVQAAGAGAATGTVTPLSDNAGAFSAPQVDAANPVPGMLSFDDVARLVSVEAAGERPRTPTGNGFCLYIRRALLDSVGELDAEGFSRGYGEENDLCLRAGRLGWRHVVDDRTWVHHRREASFGTEKRDLAAAARARIEERYPEYREQVPEFLSSPSMSRARESVGRALARGAAEGSPRPRLLFVVHDGGGGAVATNRDLMAALEPSYEVFCFSSDRAMLRLMRIVGGELAPVREWRLSRRLALGDISRADYREAFAWALEHCMPELVHIRHLYKHTFDPPRMTAARAIPTVMSFHDHYFLCPTIHLLDERGRFCGGLCTPTVGNCPTVRAGTLPPLKHAFVHQWREEAEAALADVDAFVTTSTHTREIHRRFLAAVRRRPFELVEHGRDLVQSESLAVAPVAGGPVRILIPGNLEHHKGADLLAAIVALDYEHRLELHFAGEVPEQYRHLGVMHGPYRRDDLAEKVREVAPAFVGVFSTTAESYSHAITEAWACGVPVLATDLGAQAARVHERGGGFVIPVDPPALALERILAVADDPTGYARARAQANVSGLPTVAEMTARYSELYRRTIDRRRPLVAPDGPLARGVWRVQIVGAGRGPGTVRRLHHPSVRWKVSAVSGSRGPEADLLVVEQGAIDGAGARELAGRARALGIPLVFACRSLPTADDAPLVDGAAVLVAERAALGPELARRHPEVAVLPAALDERLFGVEARGEVAGQSRARVGCVAAGLGPAELELLRVLAERLQAGGRRYEFELIGAATVAGWEQVAAPDPDADYSGYAPALRARAARWHVALAPQIQSLTADCELRRLEYAALQVPAVFSVRPECKEDTPDRGTGVACDDDVQQWCAAVQRLVSDPAVAQGVRERARAELAEAGLLRHGAGRLLGILARALARPPIAGEDRPEPAAAVSDAG